jgi:drug/metabolite transporter (DMT)-like permease
MPGMGELVVIMMILVILPLFGVWIWMVVDVASKERGQDQVVWLLVVIFAGFIGALIYLIVRRPKRIATLGR